MCGIAAQYGEVERHSAARMLQRVAHRGPDGEGSVEVGESWLGHRRLAIVDVRGGRQPLSNKSGNLRLVCNGEIYNHETIRRAFDEWKFTTNSDNEVILHLLDARGPEAIADLRGMFAFAVAGTDGRFVAARDPVGIKPLYWARKGGGVWFASELRTFDSDWRPYVEAFPPGHYWTAEDGLVRYATAIPEPRRGESFPNPPRLDADPPDHLLDKVREVLVAAVERHTMGDVPIGAFLSGGLDSSLVAAIAARYYRRSGRRLHTFSVGTSDSPDLAAARTVAEYLDTDHHEVTYTAHDAVALLPEVIRVVESFDPALVRSAVPNYPLAQLAAHHVKAVLTGEGADELFGGYEYMRSFTDGRLLHAELVRILEEFHGDGLQRCDRVAMAHGLEARPVFMDLDVIATALAVPASWKLHVDGRPEKYLLRAAFDGWLPDSALWRGKVQFGDGTGTGSRLRHEAEASVTSTEFRRKRRSVKPPLRTREEAAYYRIFRHHLNGIRPEQTITRTIGQDQRELARGSPVCNKNKSN
jgi:asparagine synthase (glutamine-hydrolysing)